MYRIKLIFIASFVIIVGSFASYYYLHKKSKSEIITIAPDTDLIKKKPEDPGGIVIPNSDSLVYEKLQSGVKKNRKINILPSPEEPIIINNLAENDDSVISLDAIDEILSNSEYYDVYTNDEASNNINEYVIPNILKNQSNETNEEVDDKILIPSSMLNITKSQDNYFNFNDNNVIKNENYGYKIQLSVASSEEDAKVHWQRIVNNHYKILGNANLITKRIEGANNRIFYMILAGTYPSLNHAKLVCKKLISRKQNCIVIK
ncbi:MAG: SPOR domain-containing protein [Rickettsiales bacterium]|nr:MAG: SPOR domain-containing protein [Rickettsiales bacterium]